MEVSYSHGRSVKRIDHAKKKARSELNKVGWQPHKIVEHNLLDLSLEKCKDTIARVDLADITMEEFQEKFEKPGIPVILTGATRNWDATEKWVPQRLYRKFRNQKFKCGEDDDGYSVKLKMKYYLDYMLNTQDDSPMYVFDSSFGDRPKTNALLKDYQVPEFFEDDLFRYATEKRRPPYRWFVMGPARSGTAIHIDPLGTSAWNALIQGHKKWCLIHPNAPKAIVKPRKDESGNHPDEAVTWFSTVYQRVTSPSWYKEFPVIHAVQNPGDIMFVPSGWWHVVMNLDLTVAVTQNFCSLRNLHQVWPKTVRGRPKFSHHWLRNLQKHRPEVVERITEISKNSEWKKIAEDQSSDSSSSSSSSDSDSDDSDSGNESNGQLRSRKRRLSLKLERLSTDLTSFPNSTPCDSCPNKMRRSPI